MGHCYSFFLQQFPSRWHCLLLRCVLTTYATTFSTTIAKASLSNSFLCGVYQLVGPIAGALVNAFGCRKVGIVGSIIAAIAFILSTFSKSIYVFQWTYGIMGGFGFGLMYLPAVIGVGFYFEKRRALATGIAVCGTGIGTFAMAPFASFLLTHLDWINAHYVLAGLLLQGCIFSSLMRPLTGRRRKPPKEADIHTAPTIVVTPIQEENSGVAEDSMKHFQPTEVIELKPRARNIAQSSSALHSNSKSQNPPKLHASAFIGPTTRTPSEIVEDLKRPLYIRNIFHSGVIHPSLEPEDEVTRSSKSIPSVHHARWSCLNKLPKPMADVIAEMVDPYILKNRKMLLLCIANLFAMTGFYVPIIFSADRAVGLGISKDNAAFLLSIMGMCNTIGRVLAGFVSYFPKVSPLLVNNVSTTLAGLSVLLTPFCTSYTTMALSIAGYGLFASTFISLSPVIICNLVGLEKLTNGFGLICLVRGITAIAGPPLEGLLYDSTGDYDATFIWEELV
ncbi:hypothetical protein EB796_009181 [Bugula neritina]|uniref:Mct1 n=1 Tax=Bugula neritina TaxID=10212 RepID=A0A7J7K1R1_BUGNE|nr:hypothetical protein EB796_009181 [Bugula neritina]